VSPVEKRLTAWLRSTFQFKDIGWAEIGEAFTRYSLLRTRWFNIYLHQLNAPAWHDECHDHPWSFVAILLWRGYLEQIGTKKFRRFPGMILYRPATFAHNVITPYGTSWSLILTTPKSRDWGFKPCEWQKAGPSTPYLQYIAAHGEK
jgi:hypothetical protein